MPRYRHVIWDWNGTLFNDVALCTEVISGLLAARGLPVVSVEAYRDLFDFPVSDYYRKLGFDFVREPFEQVGMEFIRDYEARRLEAGLYPDVPEVLTCLGGLGLAQSVLSAYHRDNLRALVEHFGLAGHFDALVGLDNHYAAGKVENGLRRIRELALHPSEVLLVGDTRHDAEVAAAMGTDCVLLDGGHQSRARLERCGHPVLDRIADLPDFLSAFAGP